MTLDEFLAQLKATPRTWALHGSYLRCQIDGRDCCPITAVDTEHLRADEWVTAADRLQLEPALLIVEAADADDWLDDAPQWDTALRAQLLAACGLTEPSQ